ASGPAAVAHGGATARYGPRPVRPPRPPAPTPPRSRPKARPGGAPGAAAGSPSPPASVAVADVDDLVLARASGRFDGDAVAGMLADQRARHRRGNRDQAQLDVGLQVADDLVALLLVGLDVGDRHLGAEYDLVAGVEPGHVDDVGVREFALELLDAAFDEALLLTRGVVLGVLLEVAVRTRVGDRGDHLRALDRTELLELGAQPLRAGQGHGCSHGVWLLKRRRAGWRAVPAAPTPGRCRDSPGNAAAPWRRRRWWNRSRAAAAPRDESRTSRRSPGVPRWC